MSSKRVKSTQGVRGEGVKGGSGHPRPHRRSWCVYFDAFGIKLKRCRARGGRERGPGAPRPARGSAGTGPAGGEGPPPLPESSARSSRGRGNPV